ncbi:MAG: iron ABC transporter permease [Actinomycetota bacterium]|nr:iron ABC transporter permease [Actinomycetota bacterium]
MTDTSSPTRLALWFGSGLVLLAFAMMGALMLGAFSIGFRDVVAWMFGSDTSDAAAQRVLTSIRLPRVLAAALFGGVLGSVGVVLQGVYRSPLADAHLLGYSSAAGVGAAIGFAVTPVAAVPVVPVLFAAAAAAAFGVTTAALRSRAGSERLILAGVAFGFAMLAWTGLFVLIVDSPRVPTFMFFVFGSLSGATWKGLIVATVVVVPATLATWRYGPGLDLLVLGDTEARALGFDTRRLIPTVVAIVGMAVGAVVVLGGVVGFVGLLIPFVLRPFVGARHRILIPAAAIGGALAVVVADTLARTIAAPSEIPLGLITAAVGGPFLGWLLLRRTQT